MGCNNKNVYAFEKFKAVKHSFDQAVVVAITDQRGRITFVNDPFCKVSKYSREELIEQDHSILYSGYHTKTFYDNIWKLVKCGKEWKGDICNRTKDGELYWVQTTIVPFLNKQGKPYRYIISGSCRYMEG
ncbi:PAS domain-containing protein [Domibacillus aminovorans]|uniref:PAS domain-containing protein n=1 Tax=Domibacillus aminovorans TaxID=29332 RepID=A0A177L4G7_9BACI|nr:PAS domain-containing protein [Domibacillus aminovorans]OAH60314.1 hypothetical protein AWH49_17005 [Domibacillus aminovorans]